MKYSAQKYPINLPEHDPELSQIIEETIELQQAVTEQERVNKEKLSTQTPTVKNAHSEPTIINMPSISNMSTDHVSASHTPSNFPLEGKVPTHEEILAKNTNYIFVFGYTGSGKSTSLTAINMYMRQHYRVILNQGENQGGIRLMHQMMRDIEHGYFPQPTSMGQITEYDTAFLMNGVDVNLTFLEMAGEDLKRVDVDTGEEGLPEMVKAYLTCPGISISFLIVADFERVVSRREDKLILQFLSYLYNEGIDMSRVGVILSKFDRGRTEMDVQQVIQNYLPQVDKWLTSGDIAQPRVFPFSIGDIQSFSHKKDEINTIHLQDCEPVVSWLHHTLSLPGMQQQAPVTAEKQSGGFFGKMKNLLKK